MISGVLNLYNRRIVIDNKIWRSDIIMKDKKKKNQ